MVRLHLSVCLALLTHRFCGGRGPFVMMRLMRRASIQWSLFSWFGCCARFKFIGRQIDEYRLAISLADCISKHEATWAKLFHTEFRRNLWIVSPISLGFHNMRWIYTFLESYFDTSSNKHSSVWSTNAFNLFWVKRDIANWNKLRLTVVRVTLELEVQILHDIDSYNSRFIKLYSKESKKRNRNEKQKGKPVKLLVHLTRVTKLSFLSDAPVFVVSIGENLAKKHSGDQSSESAPASR